MRQTGASLQEIEHQWTGEQWRLMVRIEGERLRRINEAHRQQSKAAAAANDKRPTERVIQGGLIERTSYGEFAPGIPDGAGCRQIVLVKET